MQTNTKYDSLLIETAHEQNCSTGINTMCSLRRCKLLYGQQNQTSNMTSTQQQQQNQTGIGSASEIENLTTGNIPALGNATDIESQNNTSLAQGLQREKMTTDTNMTTTQTGEGGMTNGTTTNQTGAEGEQQQGTRLRKVP